MAITSLLITALASSASAARLFGASYDGTVRTLELTSNTLKAVQTYTECGLQPSWLDIDKQNLQKPILYCIDESFNGPNSSISTHTINADGSLSKEISNKTAILGAVASTFYAGSDGKEAIALAHFASAAISTFSRTPEGQLQALQNQTFKLAQNGTGLMQDQSRPHEALRDPKGKFIVFPDYGADLVRIFTINPDALLKERESIQAKPASAPRHAVFWSPDDGKTTFLFVVHELGNTITSHKVTYDDTNGPKFDLVGEWSTFGDKEKATNTSHAAEIAIANGFLVASNRNNTLYQLDNPDPTNSTKIPSDSIVTYKLQADGKLDFVQLAPSGGTFPRHFSINKAGDLIAIANQMTEAFVVYSRCTETGVLKDRVATLEKSGNANQIIWDE